MRPGRLWVVLFYLGLLVCLMGCSAPVTLASEHNYVLIRSAGDKRVVLDEQDPLYVQFDQEVLNDPYLVRLIEVFEDTTEAFLSTNMHPAWPQAISNHVMIVIDSAVPGVLEDVSVEVQGRTARLELALGLGREGQVDLAFAREQMPSAMGALLAKLMAPWLPQPSFPPPPLEQPTTPPLALVVGFQAALDAAAQVHSVLPGELGSDAQDAAVRARLACYEGVPDSGLRLADAQTGSPRPRAEAMRTPGVVATLFHCLLEQESSYYPQRYLLWFNSYEPETIAYGKLLLVFTQLPRRDSSVETFIACYGETFPAERETVQRLAEDVFGP